MLQRSRSGLYHRRHLKAIQRRLLNVIVNFQSGDTKTIISIMSCFTFCVFIFILSVIFMNQRNILTSNNADDFVIDPLNNLNTPIQTKSNYSNTTTQTTSEPLDIETTTEIKEARTNWQKIWQSIHDINISINLKQKQLNKNRVISSERAKQIKNAFKFAWNSYVEHALGHDALSPMDGKAVDVWAGMGATLVDALDTLVLMGLFKEYKIAINTLETEINFNKDVKVSFFETTIRHLGGLIGAYNMNKMIINKYENYNDDFSLKELKEYENIILSKATNLANNLFEAFSTNTGIPKSMINLKTGQIENYGWTADKSVLAEIGSNQLEFYAISQYTQNYKYFAKSFNVYKLLSNQNKKGLFPRLIDPNSMRLTGKRTLGGMSDSFYEYLLKLWVLTNYENKLSVEMYYKSITAANEKLLTMVHDNNRRKNAYYFYGESSGGEMEELVCFMPGVLALGSYHSILRKKQSKKYNIPLTEYELKLFNDRHKHLKLAHVLVEGCYSLWNEMPTGLAPESITFDENGWLPSSRKYQLRPETIESLFILYSLNGNSKYREWGWNIFIAIQNECKTEYAYSGVNDVTVKNGRKDNQMQSYFFAETLKYLYLLFDTNTANLIPLNKYVFNTEAHLIHIQGNGTKI